MENIIEAADIGSPHTASSTTCIRRNLSRVSFQMVLALALQIQTNGHRPPNLERIQILQTPYNCN
jgi:hypothetical protein